MGQLVGVASGDGIGQKQLEQHMRLQPLCPLLQHALFQAPPVPGVQILIHGAYLLSFRLPGLTKGPPVLQMGHCSGS